MEKVLATIIGAVPASSYRRIQVWVSQRSVDKQGAILYSEEGEEEEEEEKGRLGNL